jgi:hypothetical protein
MPTRRKLHLVLRIRRVGAGIVATVGSTVALYVSLGATTKLADLAGHRSTK